MDKKRPISLLQSTWRSSFDTDRRHRPRQALQRWATTPGMEPADHHEARGSDSWHCEFFGEIVDTIRSHIAVDRSSMDPGQDAMVYALKEGFLPQDRTWIRHVREARMSAVSKVLYRPPIVKKLVDQIDCTFESLRRRGMLVTGSPGIGKSYSLINLTRYLLASNKYVVTIIPDCDKWDDGNDFLKFLLESVGVDPVLFDLEYFAPSHEHVEYLIHDIDKVLSENGKKWVFVFDQINEIFARNTYHTVNDVGLLPFPFFMMIHVVKTDRIISIISPSVNSDGWFMDSHEGFQVVEHPIQFERVEIEKLYPPEKVAQWDWNVLEYATGRVPWYLSRWVRDPKHYCDDVRDEIKHSLDKLKDKEPDFIWKEIVKSASLCVLHLSDNSLLSFDRKFLFVYDTKTYFTRIVALFPLVEEAYCEFFWEDLTAYMRKRGA